MNNCLKSTGSAVVIDYEGLVKNIEILRNYNTEKEFIVVAKNDAYNLGIEEVAKVCITEGLNTFAVANLPEALKIKSINKDTNVIILNPIPEEDLITAYENNVHLLIAYINQIEMYNKFLLGANGSGSLSFHIKFNCGMNRYGMTNEELPLLLETLESNKEVKENVIGFMTHFPQADDDMEVHEIQVQRFLRAYEVMKDKFNFKYIHSENSAAFLLKDERLSFCNFARVGIMFYGYRPFEHEIKLEPTMFLSNKIVNIRKMKKGEYLGYGENRVHEDCTVAICPVGYGDGVIAERRKFPVIIKGKKYDVVGNISMSHTYIKVDDSVKIGDVVEVYGRQIRFDDMFGDANSRMMCSLRRK